MCGACHPHLFLHLIHEIKKRDVGCSTPPLINSNSSIMKEQFSRSVLCALKRNRELYVAKVIQIPQSTVMKRVALRPIILHGLKEHVLQHSVLFKPRRYKMRQPT
jgi:hypothetical protein